MAATRTTAHHRAVTGKDLHTAAPTLYTILVPVPQLGSSEEYLIGII